MLKQPLIPSEAIKKAAALRRSQMAEEKGFREERLRAREEHLYQARMQQYEDELRRKLNA